MVIILFVIAYFKSNPDSGDVSTLLVIVLAIMSFIVALIILFYYADVITNMIDALFVCFVIDRDSQQFSRPEIHELMGRGGAPPAEKPPPPA